MIEALLERSLRKKDPAETLLFVVASVVAIGAIGVLDYYVLEIDLFFLYTLAIMVAALYLGASTGIAFSLFAAITILLSNLKEYLPDHVALPAVNFALNFAILLMITFLVVRMKTALEVETRLARQDYLTKIGNRRAFMETLQATNEEFAGDYGLCYVEVDGFNDLLESVGMARADQLLKTVAGFLKKRFQRVFRYEEDRFTILIPNADGKQTLSDLRRLDADLEAELQRAGFAVGVSVGLLFVSAKGKRVSELLKALFDVVARMHLEGGERVHFQLLT